MAALSGNYTGCSVLIYDTEGNHLTSTTVTDYDRMTLRIAVKETPPGLSVGDSCGLFILSSPAPCEYQGRVANDGMKKIIAMYNGQKKENRGAVRYNVNYPVLIEYYICDGRAYPLHTPLKAELINISKSGVRFSAPTNALSDGDRFQMRMKINDNEKLFIADVINHSDDDFESSKYGCRFLVASEREV